MYIPTATSAWPSRPLRLLSTWLAALVLVLGTAAIRPALAQISNSGVIVNPGSGNVTYGANSGTPPLFDGANLGSYDANTGVLLLNGGQFTVTEPGAPTATNAVLNYRLIQPNGTQGPFQPVNLIQTSQSGNTRNFGFSTANINLISGVTTAGNYSVEVFFSVTVVRNGRNVTLRDDNFGAGYVANFTVTGTVIGTTVWTGAAGNSNWFNAGNWTAGVPNASTNARIPDLGAGASIYPEVYADASAPVTLTNPVTYNNAGSGPAEVRNLVMDGTSQTARSILRLVAGRLNVYGDFTNQFNSFIQRSSTVLAFAGNNQTITGGSSFQTIYIDGGGTKTLTGVMEIATEVRFINGIFANNANAGSFVLLTAASGARITGETDNSFLLGLVRTSEFAPPGVTQTFGNIGLTLTFTGNDPGLVEVTRTTGQYYAPLSNTNSQPYEPRAVSIKRVFGVRPGNPNTNAGGVRADMIFRYLDSETQNIPTLATPSTNVTIPEDDLFLFVSTNSGNSFTNLGRTSINTTTNELTRLGVTTFATFTLGDRNYPLPVILTSFDAKRQGSNAQLTWSTAQERNSSGFEVQVSTDAREFRKIGFVASKSPNSATPQSYGYTDTEAGKAGIRYYRLRQVDLDGTAAFSPVRAVTFSGEEAANGELVLTAAPNPFNDVVSLAVQSRVGGAARLRVLDLSGREVYARTINANVGLTDVPLDQANSLQAGIYMVQLTMPSGEKKSLRLQKQ